MIHSWHVLLQNLIPNIFPLTTSNFRYSWRNPFFFAEFALTFSHVRCFPHVVNLTCQAVLTAITNMDFASDSAPDFDPQTEVQHDPIAMIWTAIRMVSQLFQSVWQCLMILFFQDLCIISMSGSICWCLPHFQGQGAAATEGCLHLLVINLPNYSAVLSFDGSMSFCVLVCLFRVSNSRFSPLTDIFC